MEQGMTIQTLGQRQRLYEWSQRVADCRQSGLSVKRWCEENGIVEKTYYRWQQKVFSAMVEQQRVQLEAETVTETSCFAELPTPEPERMAPGLAASIRIGEMEIRLYSGADPELVKAVYQGLRLC